jgi:excisionase family DNA binding protein
MTIIEQIENHTSALKAQDVAKLLEVTRQHLYAMAAQGTIPCFRVGAAIRFDPQELAAWLKTRYPKTIRNGRNRAA